MSGGYTIAVTGGSGRFGSLVVRDLIAHDYSVVSLDIKPPLPSAGETDPNCRHLVVDLSDREQVQAGLENCAAVIHLAAYPDPHSHASHTIFNNNVMSTYHILEAAAQNGIAKAVIASSESSYGFPWAVRPLSPVYFPVDETHPQLPQECYGLSKIVNELTGEMFHRRTGMQVVSLRLSTMCTQTEYDYLESCLDKPAELRRILWSYVDARDAAAACRLGIEADGLGAIHLNIAADETCSNIKSSELMHTFFPDVTDVRASFQQCEALYSNTRAKQALNWQPVYSWRGRNQV